MKVFDNSKILIPTYVGLLKVIRGRDMYNAIGSLEKVLKDLKFG